MRAKHTTEGVGASIFSLYSSTFPIYLTPPCCGALAYRRRLDQASLICLCKLTADTHITLRVVPHELFLLIIRHHGL